MPRLVVTTIERGSLIQGGSAVLLIVVLLLLALLFGGLGFVLHGLWIIAVIVLVFCGVAYLLDSRKG